MTRSFEIYLCGDGILNTNAVDKNTRLTVSHDCEIVRIPCKICGRCKENVVDCRLLNWFEKNDINSINKLRNLPNVSKEYFLEHNRKKPERAIVKLNFGNHYDAVTAYIQAGIWLGHAMDQRVSPQK